MFLIAAQRFAFVDRWAGVDNVWEQEKTRSQPVLVTAQGKNACAKRIEGVDALSGALYLQNMLFYC